MPMGYFWNNFLLRNITLWCVLTLLVVLVRDKWPALHLYFFVLFVKPEFVLELQIGLYSGQQIQIRKSSLITMDEVGVIFSMKKCVLNVWEAMKAGAYMHFAVAPDTVDPLV